MLKKLPKIPCTFTIIIIWITVWFSVLTTDAFVILCGKGLSKVGVEYYRFFTAGFTHANLFHLIANASTLFWIGYLFEKRIGSFKFAVVGIACAVLSQFIFLCIYQNTENSIGGSVYNFAFLGYAFVGQFMFPDFPKIRWGTWSGNWIFIYCIVSNILYIAATDMTTIVIHAIALFFGALAGIAHLFTNIKKKSD